jgi:hypothetical protein
MIYKEPGDYDDQMINHLKSDDPSLVGNSLLSICLYSGNYQLAIDAISLTINHKNEDIASCAMICIGHTARLWRKVPAEFIEIVNNALCSKSIASVIKGHADDAADDLEVFINGYVRPK